MEEKEKQKIEPEVEIKDYIESLPDDKINEVIRQIHSVKKPIDLNNTIDEQKSLSDS